MSLDRKMKSTCDLQQINREQVKYLPPPTPTNKYIKKKLLVEMPFEILRRIQIYLKLSIINKINEMRASY